MSKFPPFFEVGSDQAIRFEQRATGARIEVLAINKKLGNGNVSQGKKEKLIYRKECLKKKHSWLKE